MLRIIAFVAMTILGLILMVLAGYGVTGATRHLPDTCLGDPICIALADLDAQRSMAWAAWSMVAAALISIILTIVGAVLLLQNLAESRRASRYAAFNVAAARRTNRHALRSALAAESALAVSSKNAERQLRAYIHVDSAKLSNTEVLKDRTSTEMPKVRVTIKNMGQTPARNVRLVVASRVSSLGARLASFDDIDFTPGREPKMSGDIGAGGTRSMGGDLTTSQTNSLRVRMDSYGETIRLYYFGEILYGDVFGYEYRLRLRLCRGAKRRSRHLVASPVGFRAIYGSSSVSQ